MRSSSLLVKIVFAWLVYSVVSTNNETERPTEPVAPSHLLDVDIGAGSSPSRDSQIFEFYHPRARIVDKKTLFRNGVPEIYYFLEFEGFPLEDGGWFCTAAIESVYGHRIIEECEQTLQDRLLSAPADLKVNTSQLSVSESGLQAPLVQSSSPGTIETSQSHGESSGVKGTVFPEPLDVVTDQDYLDILELVEREMITGSADDIGKSNLSDVAVAEVAAALSPISADLIVNTSQLSMSESHATGLQAPLVQSSSPGTIGSSREPCVGKSVIFPEPIDDVTDQDYLDILELVERELTTGSADDMNKSNVSDVAVADIGAAKSSALLPTSPTSSNEGAGSNHNEGQQSVCKGASNTVQSDEDADQDYLDILELFESGKL